MNWIDAGVVGVVGITVVIGSIHFIIMKIKARIELERYIPSQEYV